MMTRPGLRNGLVPPIFDRQYTGLEWEQLKIPRLLGKAIHLVDGVVGYRLSITPATYRKPLASDGRMCGSIYGNL